MQKLHAVAQPKVQGMRSWAAAFLKLQALKFPETKIHNAIYHSYLGINFWSLVKNGHFSLWRPSCMQLPRTNYNAWGTHLWNINTACHEVSGHKKSGLWLLWVTRNPPPKLGIMLIFYLSKWKLWSLPQWWPRLVRSSVSECKHFITWSVWTQEMVLAVIVVTKQSKSKVGQILILSLLQWKLHPVASQ